MKLALWKLDPHDQVEAVDMEEVEAMADTAVVHEVDAENTKLKLVFETKSTFGCFLFALTGIFC
jgi:hypothetical protein